MKIAINCGHTLSGAGSGAIGILNESIETRNVGNALINKLKNGGHEVYNCTIDKAASQNAYLAQVVEAANRQDLDYFISIHLNAGGGKGTEVYTYEGRQYQDALEVCKNIAELGFNDRGVKAGTGLYVIRKTKAKAMLIEVCFVDSEDANRYIEVGADRIAEAVYKAIRDTSSADTVQPQHTPEPAPAPIEDDWVTRLNAECANQGFSSYPIVKKGAKGGITRLIQERLNSVGFNLTVDGDFGQKTKDAVITFQRNRSLKQDGIVGKNTWEYLVSGKKY